MCETQASCRKIETDMRIDRLEITNFKGFADRTLEFPRSLDALPGGNGSVHVLIGENGSGKTTALDALAVSLGIWHVGVGGYGWRNIGKGEVRLASGLTNGRPSFIEQVPTRIQAVGRINGEPVEWSREVRSPNGKTLNGQAGQALSIIRQLVDRARVHERGVVLPLLSYYGAGRLWLEPNISKASGKGDDQSRLSRLWAYKSCLDSRCRVRDVNQWLLDHDWESYQRGEEEAGYGLVKSAILRCLPEAKQMRFAPTRKEAVVEFRRRGEQPFSNLSDGQRNVMALVGDLAVKAVKLNYETLGNESLTRTPGVVLVDELDLHLHPTWQRVVLENLRTTFPNLQFIATTHSPFIVQTLREGELVVLEGQPIPEVGNRGIDAIARGLMGVKHPETSLRYLEMKDAAKDYLLTLEEAAIAPKEKLSSYLDRLAQGVDQFADNPAYQAFLELKRLGRLGRRISDDNKA